jgi:hypothetical protein
VSPECASTRGTGTRGRCECVNASVTTPAGMCHAGVTIGPVVAHEQGRAPPPHPQALLRPGTTGARTGRAMQHSQQGPASHRTWAVSKTLLEHQHWHHQHGSPCGGTGGVCTCSIRTVTVLHSCFREVPAKCSPLVLPRTVVWGVFSQRWLLRFYDGRRGSCQSPEFVQEEGAARHEKRLPFRRVTGHP